MTPIESWCPWIIYLFTTIATSRRPAITGCSVEQNDTPGDPEHVTDMTQLPPHLVKRVQVQQCVLSKGIVIIVAGSISGKVKIAMSFFFPIKEA